MPQRPNVSTRQNIPRLHRQAVADRQNRRARQRARKERRTAVTQSQNAPSGVITAGDHHRAIHHRGANGAGGSGGRPPSALPVGTGGVQNQPLGRGPKVDPGRYTIDQAITIGRHTQGPTLALAASESGGSLSGGIEGMGVGSQNGFRGRRQRRHTL